MTDDEIIEAVTAKLTGEFYVGQRVRFKDFVGVLADVEVTIGGRARRVMGNLIVCFDDGGTMDVNPASIEPAL